MENKTKNCPCCGNHCPKDRLQCGRGKAFFGVASEQKEERAHGFENEEEAVTLLRRCGHLLHHGGGENLLEALTAEEKETLCALLKKCLK